MDYDAIDKAMTNKLYRQGIWLCPLCGATRTIDDWHNFSSQHPPDRPCKFCGSRLIHGIRLNDGSGRIGTWWPRDR